MQLLDYFKEFQQNFKSQNILCFFIHEFSIIILKCFSYLLIPGRSLEQYNCNLNQEFKDICIHNTFLGKINVYWCNPHGILNQIKILMVQLNVFNFQNRTQSPNDHLNEHPVIKDNIQAQIYNTFNSDNLSIQNLQLFVNKRINLNLFVKQIVSSHSQMKILNLAQHDHYQFRFDIIITDSSLFENKNQTCQSLQNSQLIFEYCQDNNINKNISEYILILIYDNFSQKFVIRTSNNLFQKCINNFNEIIFELQGQEDNIIE
ncbi:hypothetical protein pb186bvf_017418 [Paramecium bursaria]